MKNFPISTSIPNLSPFERVAAGSLLNTALLFEIVRWISLAFGIVAFWLLVLAYRRTRNVGFVVLSISTLAVSVGLGFLPFLHSKAMGTDASWQISEMFAFLVVSALSVVGLGLVSRTVGKPALSNVERKLSTAIYLRGWVLGMHTAAAVFLAFGIISGGWFWFLFAIGIFGLWDLGWFFSSNVVRSRSAYEILESAMRARTYMSWFLGVYGAVLAFFLFQATPAARSGFFALCDAARINPAIFAIPFALTGLVLLFFMIGLAETEGLDMKLKDPSTANVAVLVMTAWAQKVTTFAFLYGVLRLLYYVWKNPA